MPLATMLQAYLLQNWYALSGPMAEETMYDSEAMQRFAGIELGDDRNPYETTILNFLHPLEGHKLAQALFRDRQPVPGATEADGMRKSLSRNRETASAAGLESRCLATRTRLQKRSGGYLGAAEAIDQTFHNNVYSAESDEGRYVVEQGILYVCLAGFRLRNNRVNHLFTKIANISTRVSHNFAAIRSKFRHKSERRNHAAR
jgi:hypothetical protein